MYDTKGISNFNFQVKSYVYDQNDTMFWNFYWIQFAQGILLSHGLILQRMN